MSTNEPARRPVAEKIYKILDSWPFYGAYLGGLGFLFFWAFQGVA